MSMKNEITRLEKLAEDGDVSAQERLLELQAREGDAEAHILRFLMKRGREALHQVLESGEKIDLQKLSSADIDKSCTAVLVEFMKQHLLHNPPKSIFERLMEEAKFDWVKGDITEARFPINEEPVLEGLEVLHLDECFEAEEILRRIDQAGYRPATFAELILYSIHNPDEQRQYPIVGFGSGSLIYGLRQDPYLYRYGSKRDLLLRGFGLHWDERFRFLVRRK